ncbi:hypothetical protein B0T21DRAFT_345788 [Apiosordaria backusii]|uniref:Rad60/SUMO-like domain-containing protein n=1 Tax=Apiosordaria backusii TaxID=314023 RepID=A0AA40K103_9PEZI|nr:hypothetical protein B0T21DRAFT_345788 [Apiosordaria backusii]
MARLPFQRKQSQPKPASTVTLGSDDEDDDALALFRHSKEVFPEVIRQAEEENRDRGNDRKRKSSPSEDDGNERGRRRRTSSPGRSSSPPQHKSALDESDDDDIIMDIKGKGKEIVRPTKIITPVKPRPAVVSASPVVVVDDSDNDDDALPTATPARDRKPVKADLDSDDDSDIQEVHPFEKEEAPPNSDDDELQAMLREARERQERTHNAIARVFVSSHIPNTKTLMFRRRVKQDVQAILDNWIEKQQEIGLDFDKENNKLFVTWKGNKVYGHSTLSSLKIETDGQGEIIYPDEPGYRHTKAGPALLLEVWDEDTYKSWLQWKDKDRAFRYGLVDSDEADDDDAEPAPEEPKKKGIKVVLKAKDLEPLKMSVQEDITVGFMIEAFCQKREVGEEWHVSIWLEGDELDEDTLVKDADIDPDEPNQFEVHMKKQ